MRSRYDVVIVGGGHNGLAAAAYLARAGRSCLVLERRGVLGGAAVSERVFAGVDARLSRHAYLVSLLPDVVVRELGLPLTLVRRRVASYTPDPRVAARRGLLVDASDPLATADSYRAITGGDGELRAVQRLAAMQRRIAGAVFQTLTEPLLSREQMRSLVGDDEAWRLVFEEPLGDGLARLLHDDLVTGTVLTDAMIGVFAAAGDRDLRQNRCFLYHVIGRGTGDWLVPVGGMGAVGEALAEAARAAGAQLQTGAEVAALEPRTDRVRVAFTDAEAEGGAEVSASHVLVNAAPEVLKRLLASGGSGANEGRAVAEGAAPAEDGVPAEGAALKLNMVLSRLPRLRDPDVAPERAFAGTFHVNESATQLQQAHDQAAGGAIPSVVPCESYCHSLTDPSILAPALRAAGMQTLTVFALQMPARLFASDPQGARDAAVAATLRSLDSVLAEPIAGFLATGPGGEPCLQASTPLDIEQELAMPGGHIFHRDLAWPFAERREDVGTWGVETDHPRILLCGAGARRGGGVSAVPGRNAAMALLRRQRGS